MEAKPRTTSVKKTDKGGTAVAGDKKEGSVKEQSNPTSKKTTPGDSAPVNHENTKPTTAPEPQGPPSTTENKTNGDEQEASNGAAEGSGFEGLKPILVAAGVAVAAIAVIVGVVFLARKK